MKIKSLLSAAAVSAITAFAPVAHSAYVLSFQGVDFTIDVLDDNTFKLTMEGALSASGDWADATSLSALGFKGLGVDFSASGVSATLVSVPADSTAWVGLNAELNAQGCSTNGNPDQAICFSGVPALSLTDLMTFTVDISGATLDVSDDGPHLKLKFLDADGKKAGSLLSQDLPWESSSSSGLASSSSGLASSSGNVPEPSSSVLALLGLGLVGGSFLLRRKAAGGA